MSQRHSQPASRRGLAGVTAVLVAAGVLFATSAGVADGSGLRNDGDLPGIIRSETTRLEDVEAQVVALQQQVETLTAGVQDPAVRQLQAQAAKLAMPAQMEPVTGPGLRITLDDAPNDVPVPEGVNPNALVVHQQDLQAFVNAMWAGGAEAMMLMDQRVISTSAVRCVGSTLRLQGQVYSPPYVIQAIGDPEKLRDALDDSTEVLLYRDYARALGLGYELEERKTMEMPAFTGAVEMRYAEVPS